jgi:hypothetical protein
MALLKSKPEVIAAWEGGSAATGFLDEFSDLDLSIVIKEGETSAIFAALETFFTEHYSISDSFTMPEPCWHGMSQRFYLIGGMPELFYCDIAVVKAENPHKFTEPERHGNAIIWFDNANIYKPEPTPQAELDALAKRFFHIATDTAFLGIIELRKALARKNWISSQMNYNTFINRHLVILLNLKYRPEKVDFGIRYADRDYPEEVVAKLAELLRITSVKHIEANFEQALPMFESLKQELSCVYA